MLQKKTIIYLLLDCSPVHCFQILLSTCRLDQILNSSRFLQSNFLPLFKNKNYSVSKTSQVGDEHHVQFQVPLSSIPSTASPQKFQVPSPHLNVDHRGVQQNTQSLIQRHSNLNRHYAMCLNPEILLTQRHNFQFVLVTDLCFSFAPWKQLVWFVEPLAKEHASVSWCYPDSHYSNLSSVLYRLKGLNVCSQTSATFQMVSQ